MLGVILHFCDLYQVRHLTLTDLSPLVPWPFVVLGIPVSFLARRSIRSPRGVGRFLSTGFVAFCVGLALSFATSALHTACIESLHLCTSRGDGNMSYWFHALLAFPLYWAAIYAPRPSELSVVADTTLSDKAVLAALAQFQTSGQVSERCPECSTPISITTLKSVPSDTRLTVQTTCGCRKCAGKFALNSKRA